jgi:DNA-binding CsgD family transcriptional regulator
MKRPPSHPPSSLPRTLRAVELVIDDERFVIFDWAEPALAMPTRLTHAERDVAALWASGESARAISARRGVSIATVRNQVRAAYEKLGVSSRAELIARLRRPS